MRVRLKEAREESRKSTCKPRIFETTKKTNVAPAVDSTSNKGRCRKD